MYKQVHVRMILEWFGLARIQVIIFDWLVSILNFEYRISDFESRFSLLGFRIYAISSSDTIDTSNRNVYLAYVTRCLARKYL